MLNLTRPKKIAYYPSFVTLIALLLTLAGLFSVIRVALHLVFSDVYPANGVLPPLAVSSSLYPVPFQREEDCEIGQYFYGMDGGLRQPSDQERRMEKENKDRCLDNVRYVRQQAKLSDVSTAAFLLFLGLGLLLVRPFFFKPE